MYNLTKKQANKVKDKEKYLVAQGCFKNRLKQGKFIFTNGIDKLEFGSIYKEISFVNDTVHGQVIEMINTKLNHLTAYNMGIEDGFYFWNDGCYVIIRFYKNGEVIEEKEYVF